MDGMSNACEYTGIRNLLFNTPDDHARLAMWGVYGTNFVIAQWAYSHLCEVGTGQLHRDQLIVAW